MQGLPIAWHSAATIFTLRSAPRRDFSFYLKGIGSYRTARDARVAELVDAHDSKSCSARSGGSIPSTGTIGTDPMQFGAHFGKNDGL